MARLLRLALLLSAASALQCSFRIPALTAAEKQRLTRRLGALDSAIVSYKCDGAHGPVLDSCLSVCNVLTSAGGASVPSDVESLTSRAPALRLSGSKLERHFFDAWLLDELLDALAAVAEEANISEGANASEGAMQGADASEGANASEGLDLGSQVLEVGAAVAASARFILLPRDSRDAALQTLAAAVTNEELLDARRRALESVRSKRRSPSERSDHGPTLADEERILAALSSTLGEELRPKVLRPLGFPPSALGAEQARTCT